MIKLNSICDRLEEIASKLEEKIEAITDKAWEKDRELTEKEEERIQELEDEKCAIENALDYLMDYYGD